MVDTANEDTTGALVHWTYSRDEWNRFMRWKKRRKSMLHYLLYRAWSGRSVKTPDIVITPREIRTDGTDERFHAGDNELRRVSIQDAGRMNILEISYEKIASKLPDIKEVHILVPKGKLREAIELQGYLLHHHKASLRR